MALQPSSETTKHNEIFMTLMGIMKKLSFVTGYKRFFDQKELKKMSLSVLRSVVEPFKLNEKSIRTVHVNGEECLVSRDVYKAIGNEDKNGKKSFKIQFLTSTSCVLET